ncbi:MAG: hypothetical protein U1C74_26310, partial [Phenylobacterium sp.]|nr:hypothetical protein [Phenylobacterium sp.]
MDDPNTQAPTLASSPSEGPRPGEVQLEEPIRRGDQVIGMLRLRKPKSGELRGLSLSELLNSDVSAIIKVLPRITSPSITEAEADE